MSVGRLVEKKGHHYLVEACHLLQKEGVDFECRILGDGPLKSELEAMITRYNLAQHVHLLGGQPQQEVLAQLSQSDVFVLACVVAKNGDRDGMPVSLAEAMAMEIPVISTDLVGIGEMIKPGAGYLVPPEDPVALAEAIKTMNMIGGSKRIEMGKYGRTIIAEEFELFKGIHHLADLFLEAIAEEKVKTSSIVQVESLG
jgi:glycosyltransferase involved in cell wall biosynthesis